MTTLSRFDGIPIAQMPEALKPVYVCEILNRFCHCCALSDVKNVNVVELETAEMPSR